MTMAVLWKCVYITALGIRQTDYPTDIRQPASDKLTRRALVDAVTNIYHENVNLLQFIMIVSERHEVLGYIEDAVVQLLEHREENPKVNPTKFFSD